MDLGMLIDCQYCTLLILQGTTVKGSLPWNDYYLDRRLCVNKELWHSKMARWWQAYDPAEEHWNWQWIETPHLCCAQLDQDDNYMHEWPTHQPRPPVGWRAIV